MTLQSLYEQLVQELQNKLVEVKQVESREKAITAYETVLKNKAKELEEKNVLVTKKLVELKQEKEFISRKIAELQKREDIASRLIAQGEEIKKRFAELEEKMKALGMREFKVREDEQKVKQERLELEKRISGMEKQLSIDRERKAALDLQSEVNAKERERLQHIAMQYEK